MLTCSIGRFVWPQSMEPLTLAQSRRGKLMRPVRKANADSWQKCEPWSCAVTFADYKYIVHSPTREGYALLRLTEVLDSPGRINAVRLGI